MPFGNALSGWHLVILLVVILLLFGAPKLPGLARSLGQSMRIFRSEVKTMKDENSPSSSTDDSVDSSGDTPPKP
ncbi:Sec-independent protein translocase subunit TatA [Rhodoglobus sp. NPDC076762]